MKHFVPCRKGGYPSIGPQNLYRQIFRQLTRGFSMVINQTINPQALILADVPRTNPGTLVQTVGNTQRIKQKIPLQILGFLLSSKEVPPGSAA